MKFTIETPRKGNEVLDEKWIKELLDFVKKNNISGQEFSQANFISLGAPPEAEPEKPVREEVYALAKRLDDVMAEGLPVSKVIELIEAQKDYDSAYKNYNEMVDQAMQISDKEKKTLKAIVDGKKQCVLTVSDAQTGELLEKINTAKAAPNGELLKDDLASFLTFSLKRYKNQKIRITFSEA